MGARFRQLYGASPVHAAGIGASLLIVGVAVSGWFDVGTDGAVRVLIWFVGAIIAHDLVFLPLVQVVNRVVFHRAAPPAAVSPAHARLRNHVRIPAMLSGLLLLVFAPVILRANRNDYGAASSLSPDPYLHRWLLLSAGLFALSAAILLAGEFVRRRSRQRMP